jgi:molecular chaperone GrpE
MSEQTNNPETKETESPTTTQTNDSIGLEALKKDLEEQKNRYLYLYAEFDTFKKRSIKERSDLLKFGHENLSKELLQVSDNLERALEHTANVDSLVQGLKMVHQQLLETLQKFGVQKIEVQGKAFDPQFHEAVGTEKNDSVTEGHIVREAQKGYTLHGRLLRAARVLVASKN